MKINSWAATALAAPAIATGVCMLSSATAQASPDDTSSSVSAGPATDRDDTKATSSSAARGKARATAGSAAADDRSDSSLRKRDAGTRAAEEREVEIDDDAAEESLGIDETTDETDAVAEQSDPDGADATPAQPQPRKAALTAASSNPLSSKPRAAQRFVTVDTLAARHDSTVEATADDDVDTVGRAIEQIAAARADLDAAVWNSGNILAGLAAMLPQMWLGGAQSSLVRWQEGHELLQARFAATVDNPFAHWIAGQRIEASIMRVVRVQDQLEAADKWLDVVHVFTRQDLTDISELIDEASDNGLVYQILDIFTERGPGGVRVNPIFQMSINGGEYVNVLLDTGSLGLVINPQVIGLENVPEPVDHGEGCYGDCTNEYRFDVYEIPISVAEGVDSTATPVLVVTLSTWENVAKENGDFEGILGIGANNELPWTNNPLTALPGLLGRGILIDERRNRAILGPNPYAARVTVDGSPISDLTVKIGDYDEYVGQTWLDTGGLLGTLPKSLIDGDNGVPPGTLISVYTEDGETLLFSYRTTRSNTPTFTDPDESDTVLFGWQPWVGASVYTDFTGSGSTSFNYR
ncbi:PecA family PE domain-processing aspartic protease [Mycobacterium sp. SMC-4]|uniref:PecA family PE domain-processing aspartic protease n=1 Tax=Mycobacterium sp. SMC-4 TaxID=2857059 RepID=UPI003CFF0CBB